jgi:hypothetical protein
MGARLNGPLCLTRVGVGWIDPGTLVLTRCPPPGSVGRDGKSASEILDESLSPGLRHMLRSYGIHVTDAMVIPPGGRLPETKEKQLCVLQRGDCRFVITDNPKANGSAPRYERPEFSEVKRFGNEIDTVAELTQVDGRLIRAVMYVETTHGYYSYLKSWYGGNTSIRPMKVNVAAWGNTFGTRAELDSPTVNILAGATILKGIAASLPQDAPLSHVATLYNNLNANTVTDYGARVAAVYAERTWEK